MNQSATSYATRSLVVLLAAMSWAGGAFAADPPAAPASKPTARQLCDENWAGDFYTVFLDWNIKYDPAAIKEYNPQKPEEPWTVRDGRYLRTRFDPRTMMRLIGRFNDRAEAKAFESRIVREEKFARYTNPRFPVQVNRVGALLVNDTFTCKVRLENEAMASATWIVEVDGRLVVGGETACKNGKKTKTVQVVDCAGEKTLVADKVITSCGARITSCLNPIPDGAIVFEHIYVDDGATTVAVRAFDLNKKKRVFIRDGINEGGEDTALLGVLDVDGDGVPEVAYRIAGSDKVVQQWKWRNRGFAKVGP